MADSFCLFKCSFFIVSLMGSRLSSQNVQTWRGVFPLVSFLQQMPIIQNKEGSFIRPVSTHFPVCFFLNYQQCKNNQQFDLLNHKLDRLTIKGHCKCVSHYLVHLVCSAVSFWMIWIFFNSLQKYFDNFLSWSLIGSSGSTIRKTKDFIMKVGWSQNHDILAIKTNGCIL